MTGSSLGSCCYSETSKNSPNKSAVPCVGTCSLYHHIDSSLRWYRLTYEDRQDVRQAAAMHVIRHSARLALLNESELKLYIRRVCGGSVVNLYRQKRLVSESNRELGAMMRLQTTRQVAGDASPAIAELAVELHALFKIIEDLPSQERRVWKMTFLEGLTLAQAARELGVPQGTIASRLRRARCKLGERVSSLRSAV